MERIIACRISREGIGAIREAGGAKPHRKNSKPSPKYHEKLYIIILINKKNM
jgi:hypothetical protein